MGLAVTLRITELDENRMVMKRSRFPKAMGIMMLCISFVFLIMYKAATVYIWLLFYSSSILDKGLFFAIMTMPGLPKKSAAERIDVDSEGKISGLF